MQGHRGTCGNSIEKPVKFVSVVGGAEGRRVACGLVEQASKRDVVVSPEEFDDQLIEGLRVDAPGDRGRGLFPDVLYGLVKASVLGEFLGKFAAGRGRRKRCVTGTPAGGGWWLGEVDEHVAGDGAPLLIELEHRRELDFSAYFTSWHRVKTSGNHPETAPGWRYCTSWGWGFAYWGRWKRWPATSSCRPMGNDRAWCSPGC
ncbi:hypothetical protein [Amycolatopsis sp. NPDC051371]|uniref:hypothetical protein n=1 Tax=Amycolatopsis sp. NPDC051371 TaxID=3155800 RepID=UPI0034234477